MRSSHYDTQVDMQMKKSTLFFDLDGTITDSGEGIMRSAQYTLAKFGIEVADWRTLRPFVGPPLEDSFMDFYGFSHDDAMRAMEVYREDYIGNERVVRDNFPYEGIEDCLRALREAGYRLVIATSKPKSTAEMVLRYFRLDAYFDFVAGRDAHDILHTKAEVITDAMRQLQLLPDEIVMIGDRKFDIEGAHECGIRTTVGILWGYGDWAEMEACGADYIVATIPDLTALLCSPTFGV